MFLDSGTWTELARLLGGELYHETDQFTLKGGLDEDVRREMTVLSTASMRERYQVDLLYLAGLKKPTSLLTYLDAALSSVGKGAVRAAIRDARERVTSGERERQMEPARRPPRHHLLCDRQAQWEALDRALKGRSGLVVLPGPPAAGHTYFADRVALFADQLSERNLEVRRITWRDGWPRSVLHCYEELSHALDPRARVCQDLPAPIALLQQIAGGRILVLVHPCCGEGDADVVVSYHADMVRVLYEQGLEQKIVRVQPVSWAPPQGPLIQVLMRLLGVRPGLPEELVETARRVGTARAEELPPLGPIVRTDLDAFAQAYVHQADAAGLVASVWEDGCTAEETLHRLADYLADHPSCLKEPQP